MVKKCFQAMPQNGYAPQAQILLREIAAEPMAAARRDNQGNATAHGTQLQPVLNTLPIALE
jgi:hypothetical protein